MSSKKREMEMVDWVSSIGGVISLVGILIPITREVLVAHPLWGWTGLILVLVSTPFTGRAGGRTRRLEKSVALISERLSGWEVNSSNFHYLEARLDHNRMPVSFVRDFEASIDRWSRDARPIQNRKLKKVWAALVESSEAYRNTWEAYLDQSDRVRRNSQGVVSPYFEISPLLKSSGNGEEYRAASADLAQARSDVVEKMQSVHRILHEYA